MPLAKPSAQGLFQLQSAAPRAIKRHAAWLRRALGTIAQFALQVESALPLILFSAVCWIVSEFLKGCALYAQTMYPIPGLIDDGAAPGDRDRSATSPNGPEAAPAPRRARLVVVSINSTTDIQPQPIGTVIADGRTFRTIGRACGEIDLGAKRERRRR